MAISGAAPRLSDERLMQLGLDQLRQRLPPRWSIEAAPGLTDPDQVRVGRMIVIKSSGMDTTDATVEVRRSLTPQDARRLLEGPVGLLDGTTGDDCAVIVVAPYLSPRTRELLATRNVGYIDLAGNIRLELENLLIDIERASRNPNPAPTPPPGLRGAAGGRVVRVLVDAAPPYALTDIAKAAGVDRGYGSRILDALSDEALIERAPRGKVTSVDWPALLRARAQHLDLLSPPAAQGFVAPRGGRQMIADLTQRPPQDLWAVTGSFAAVRIAPVAAPALLVVYTINPGLMASEQRLLEAGEGADVVLVRPSNYGPFDRAQAADGIVWAGLSQIVLDSLSGNGRMPAEGEALLDWMVQHETEWRIPIDQLPPPAGKP